jgi:predicted nucleotidyltransferase
MLTLQQISDTVSTYFQDKPVKRVFLFGSYAKGLAKEQSDIDLLLELDYDKKIGLEFIRWQLYLQGLFETKVDLVPMDSVLERVKQNIDGYKILIANNIC